MVQRFANQVKHQLTEVFMCVYIYIYVLLRVYIYICMCVDLCMYNINTNFLTIHVLQYVVVLI